MRAICEGPNVATGEYPDEALARLSSRKWCIALCMRAWQEEGFWSSFAMPAETWLGNARVTAHRANPK
jgi:hypothetical protein